MKITTHILSIPPYISTSWENITSLHVDHALSPWTLVVTLTNGTQIQVPHVDKPLLESIFVAHTRYIEQNQRSAPQATNPLMSFSAPFIQNGPFGNMGAALQHNPDHMDAPDLPTELLRQVANFPKQLNLQDLDAIPEPEPHCNCVHCQIAKALKSGVAIAQESKALAEEEMVSDEDLKFREWNIIETSTRNLFTVNDPLNENESYYVYLEEPIGCTCGEKHCKHLRAVLNN